ncbi:porin [Cupriavidus sp. 30B13]|uniref:porin n=1 Tax=Cupriavidus sp. 30B13 TaxID=3384241 RepID=UPI003B8ED090
MKKKCLAAMAAALCSAGAQAQSSGSGLALYGRTDVGVVTQTSRAPGGSAQAVNSNVWQPSLWGLRGQEDLGGGLAVYFNAASTILVDSGAPGSTVRLFDRHAYVGLTDQDLGTISFGRHVNTLAELFYVTDPLRANNSATNMNVRFGYLGGPGAVLAGNFGANAGMAGNNLDRQDNTIKYAYVGTGGIVGMAMYSFGENAGNFRGNSSAGLLAGYDGASFNVRAAAMKFKDADGVALNAYAVGGAYTVGGLKLKATWTQNKADSGVAPYGHLKTQVYSGGATYSLAKSLDVTLAYYHGSRSQDAMPKQVARKFYLTPEYYLSRRTILFGILELERFNATGALLDTGTPLSAGARSSVQVAVGISHSF